MSRHPASVVVGVGNRDRGDDAVGPVVCDLVEATEGPRPRTVVVESSPLDLSLRWGPDDHVVVVDAAPPAGAPGRLCEIEVGSNRLSSPRPLSTHGIDLGAAIELGRLIDRMPRSMTIVSIEAVGFELGAPLSPQVARAARTAAELVLR